jgi:hypothetical protein
MSRDEALREMHQLVAGADLETNPKGADWA